mgnify:CR=1 FL=1
MAISGDIDSGKLDQAIKTLGALDREFIEPEFQKAADQTVNYLVKDLRSGVNRVSGDLRSAITGEVQRITGADVTMLVSDLVQHKGYDYAGRLDKDGSLHWRSGRFAGKVTFGWFSLTLKRNAPRALRRYYRQATEKVVERLARAL